MRGALVMPVLCAALSACHSREPAPAPSVAEGDEHIACAVGGAKVLSETCAVERAEKDGRLSLIVRHPDGAFRRFEVLTDGRGLAVADGADEATTKYADGKLEVVVGQDRYVFPAKAKASGGQAGTGAAEDAAQ